MDTATIHGIRARVAVKFGNRLKGLIGSNPLPPGEGMFFPNCNAIHTLFMSYPIDVVFLNREYQVVKIVKNVKPWQPFIWGGKAAVHVLETAATDTTPK